MGYMRYHAIVVTSSSTEAHEKAEEIFGELVSPIVYSVTNGYNSFFVAPDGSKEGWETSDNYDDKRKEFIEWLRSQAYEDGSNSMKYIEVQFGDDNNEDQIINSVDMDERNRSKINCRKHI
jgi:hypothetical protein